jgi:hypothetical protein
MAQVPSVVKVRVVVTNIKAVRRFAEAYEAIRQATEDYPWSEDLKEACRNLKYVAKQMEITEE